VISFTESSAEYHASPAIGSSDIRDYLRSPALFHDKREGLVPDKETPALILGTLTHLAMLEPERFRQSIAIKPEGMSFASKEGKSWKEAHDGRQIITMEDYCTISMMAKRMPDEVQKALSSGKSEVTVRTMLNGLGVQCRTDHWNRPGRIVFDLKSIGAIEDIEREIYKRGYHIQAKFYTRVIKAETNEDNAFVLIFAEKSWPFRWRIVELDPDYQDIADKAIDDALHGIVARTKSGDWSDPESLHLIASPPAWMTENIDSYGDE